VEKEGGTRAGRWPSPETGETTTHRPNSSRGAVSGAQSGLRVSAEGGGALKHAGVRRGGRAWKKIKWEEGGPAASQAAGGERLGTWRRKIGGPGSGVRCERGG
jgi:hypothetical protein